MNEAVRQCYVCGGPMLWGTTTHCEETRGRHLIFECVPALVCDHCGEAAITGVVLDEIERIAHDQPTPTRTVVASVYDLAGVAVARSAGGG